MQRRALDQLLQATGAADPAMRKRATRELCPCEPKRSSPEAWDRIFASICDPDPGVWCQALHTLIDGSPREREPEVIDAIEDMRNDSGARLRRHARPLLARHRRTGRVNFAAR